MTRHNPGNCDLLTGSWGVGAWSKDWEGAEEGGVRLLEEVAEGCYGFLCSEDRGEGGELLEVVCTCCCCKWAVEYDVMVCVMMKYPIRGWGLG